jgi:mono/diheme cytochrome c family protein
VSRGLRRLAPWTRALPLLAAIAPALACGSPTSGKPVTELWRESCTQCHGEDGRGNAAWKGLDPKVDLSRSELVRSSARGLVFQRIAYGYGTMPGFGHKLERGDVEMLTEFVFELQTQRSDGR